MFKILLATINIIIILTMIVLLALLVYLSPLFGSTTLPALLVLLYTILSFLGNIAFILDSKKTKMFRENFKSKKGLLINNIVLFSLLGIGLWLMISNDGALVLIDTPVSLVLIVPMISILINSIYLNFKQT